MSESKGDGSRTDTAIYEPERPSESELFAGMIVIPSNMQALVSQDSLEPLDTEQTRDSISARLEALHSAKGGVVETRCSRLRC